MCTEQRRTTLPRENLLMQHKAAPAFTLGGTETCRMAAIHMEQPHLPHEPLGEVKDQHTANNQGHGFTHGCTYAD